jgi:hypothetical protein
MKSALGLLQPRCCVGHRTPLACRVTGLASLLLAGVHVCNWRPRTPFGTRAREQSKNGMHERRGVLKTSASHPRLVQALAPALKFIRSRLLLSRIARGVRHVPVCFPARQQRQSRRLVPRSISVSIPRRPQLRPRNARSGCEYIEMLSVCYSFISMESDGAVLFARRSLSTARLAPPGMGNGRERRGSAALFRCLPLGDGKG